MSFEKLLERRETFEGGGPNGLHAEKKSHELDIAIESEDAELLQARARYFELRELAEVLLDCAPCDSGASRALRIADTAEKLGPEAVGQQNVDFYFGALLGSAKTGADTAQLRSKMHEAMAENLRTVAELWHLNTGRMHEDGESFTEDVSKTRGEVVLTARRARQLDAEYFHRRCELGRRLAALVGRMVSLVEEFGLKYQPWCDRVEAEHLVATVNAIASKLRMVKATLISETYTPATVAALKRIRREVDSALTEAQEAHKAASNRLQQYDAVAKFGFAELAKQYTTIMDRVRHLTWSLEQL
mmetsp:Transcript_5744/g.17107  ORF Transcript_5744/g.17107 Transcript_5744/m.17107 type:complete len:302 (+) Transcript_5744:85-990(+)